jgi:predicted RNA binding protein YcfA (HicA-like mRNA interferase family)
MPKLPVLTATEAERILLGLGFYLLRTKGSHRIYRKTIPKSLYLITQVSRYIPK